MPDLMRPHPPVGHETETRALSLGNLSLLVAVAALTCGGAATAPGWPTTWFPPFPVVPRTTHDLARFWHGLFVSNPLPGGHLGPVGWSAVADRLRWVLAQGWPR